MSTNDDEINLIEYWNKCIKHIWQIVTVAAVVTAMGLAYALLATEQFTSKVTMIAVDEDSGGGLSDLVGQFGGVAALAGISFSQGGVKQEALAIVKSRKFIEGFIKDNKLQETLLQDYWDENTGQWKDPEDPPTMWDAHKLFKDDVFKITEDQKNGTVILTVIWRDPMIASNWANSIAERVNNTMREQAITLSNNKMEYLKTELTATGDVELKKSIYSLMDIEQQKAMIANVRKEYAFRIIDPATPADKRSWPLRALIVLASAFLGGVIGVFSALIRPSVSRE